MCSLVVLSQTPDRPKTSALEHRPMFFDLDQLSHSTQTVPYDSNFARQMMESQMQSKPREQAPGEQAPGEQALENEEGPTTHPPECNAKRRKACGICGRLGHNRQTCMRLKEGDHTPSKKRTSNVLNTPLDDALDDEWLSTPFNGESEDEDGAVARAQTQVAQAQTQVAQQAATQAPQAQQTATRAAQAQAAAAQAAQLQAEAAAKTAQVQAVAAQATQAFVSEMQTLRATVEHMKEENTRLSRVVGDLSHEVIKLNEWKARMLNTFMPSSK